MSFLCMMLVLHHCKIMENTEDVFELLLTRNGVAHHLMLLWR